jgi:hypothetical protein
MRAGIVALAAGACLFAAPILAQTPPAGAPPSDTIKEVIAKGVMVNFGGMEVDFAYNADGTFTGAGAGGQFVGKYRVDGKKFCITSDMLPQELCQEYPDGKKSGDTFELTSDFGTSTVKIN